MTRKLVLFDIDGTLMTAGRAARDAFADALEAVYGYDGPLDRYDFSGRTDPQIATMILRDAGWSDGDIEGYFPDLWAHYLGALARNVPGQARVLPGIGALLEALAADPRVVLALLTGNIEPGARLKLGAAGLNGFFPFGAFGSDSAKREELPPIAVARAAARDGHEFAARDVVIIGDSIYDVRCGVPHSARTIAVASGKTPRALLAAENPDFLFDSAEDREAVLAAVLGE
jgi:phosphoglycolate phosphatase-like HAD superfamily hydrolase